MLPSHLKIDLFGPGCQQVLILPVRLSDVARPSVINNYMVLNRQSTERLDNIETQAISKIEHSMLHKPLAGAPACSIHGVEEKQPFPQSR